MSLAAAVAAAEGPPRFLDVRFDAQRHALRCSGNTIVSHVTPAARGPIVAMQESLAGTEAGACFAWLPPASLHMTVFDGLLHDRRGPGYWPADLDPGAGAQAADAFMSARLTALPPPDIPLAATVTGVDGLGDGGLGLRVVPDREAVLRAYRDDCAAAVGLTARPGHETYRFHITLAYLVAWPSADAAAAFDVVLEKALGAVRRAGGIDLGPAEFCLFDNMTHFAPQN